MPSSLQMKLLEDLREAMRSRDALRVTTLRYARAGLQNEEIARRNPLGEEDVLRILGMQASQRRDSIRQFREGNRLDLAEKEEAELAILLEYLPKPLSHAEVETLAKRVISELGAKYLSDKGKVMRSLMPQIRGRADGSTVNTLLAKLLDP